jgi:hypothetical protein
VFPVRSCAAESIFFAAPVFLPRLAGTIQRFGTTIREEPGLRLLVVDTTDFSLLEYGGQEFHSGSVMLASTSRSAPMLETDDVDRIRHIFLQPRPHVSISQHPRDGTALLDNIARRTETQSVAGVLRDIKKKPFRRERRQNATLDISGGHVPLPGYWFLWLLYRWRHLPAQPPATVMNPSGVRRTAREVVSAGGDDHESCKGEMLLFSRITNSDRLAT